MSCSSAAASQALPGRSGVRGGKRVLLAGGRWQAAGGGGPFPAIAPEQGEGRLPVRALGFSPEAWLVEKPGWQRASAVSRRSSGGEMWVHKWGNLSGPVLDT